MKTNPVQTPAQVAAKTLPVDPLSQAIRLALRAELDGLRDQLVEALVERQEPKLMDSSALAVALNISIPTLRKLEAEGLPFVRLGTVHRYRWDAVVQWLESRPREPTRDGDDH